MIYNNLFNINNSEYTKDKTKKRLKNSEYNILFILDSKYYSLYKKIVIAPILFTTLCSTVYIGANSYNKIKINSLLNYKEKFEKSFETFKSQYERYNLLVSNIDNIYNMTIKPIKWSEIINDISKKLPYNCVLTNIASIRQDAILIEGYSYSQVNISLFLNGLNSLNIFDRVEAIKTGEDKANNRFVYTIHAYIKK